MMKIALLGDIALFGRMSVMKNQKATEYFSEVADFLERFDYVVGNLESPFSKEKKYGGPKSAYLCSDPENIELLKFLKVNAVTLANNHMFDYGREGYELTKELLGKAKIEWFGAEGKEIFVETKDNRLAFTGWCCYSTNPLRCVEYGKYGVNEFDVDNAVRTLEKYSKEGWLNIAAVHAGIEHVNYPSIDTIKVADKLSKIGPMVYYGHHPHVAQAVERKGNSLIAYSLGNFCFDDTYTPTSGDKPLVELSEANRSSFILCVTIEHNIILKYEIIPIHIGKDKIHVGKGVTIEQLNDFSKKMQSLNSEDYEKMRLKQRMEWLAPRLASRNFRWYLKRLRPRYIRLMYTNKDNSRKYADHVKKYL